MTEWEQHIIDRLVYNPDTGIITWKEVTRGKIVHGREAGYLSKGYRMICVDYVKKFGHVFAWFLHYNKWPNGEIDHINGIKNDNRICNLREVTHRENALNRKCHRKGKLYGVTFHSECAYTCPWEAKIRLGGKVTHLGNYKTEAEAHLAYCKAHDNLEMLQSRYDLSNLTPEMIQKIRKDLDLD
jgi:hypothetical protein